MYEPRTVKPLSTHRFARRLAFHFGLSQVLVIVSLLGGMLGYEKLESLPWRDAFENAAMLLGGMGPVNIPVTNGGKVFAGLYALYSGLVFLVVAAMLLTPMVHRIMHKLHWEESKS
ncbi:MAG TPA: hypothetical protein VGP80_00835 [Gemmatimonadales bacterium]|jgi:glucose uptake protein GlcU|nr:hypothetical protein [Gemmatimonadales bacterium]